MWDSVKDLDLPMVMNEDYEGQEKQKHGCKARRTKEAEGEKAEGTSTTAKVNFRDRLVYAHVKSMEYENLQMEWESGMAMLVMEANGLKEEIATPQFMIAQADLVTKQQYLERMVELLNKQRQVHKSLSEHSNKRPKLKKMDVMYWSVIDLSVGRDGNDSQVSAIAGAYKQVNEKKVGT
jgi:hypothetical protein